MKTTIDISNPLLLEAKQYLGKEAKTMKELVESALRLFLDSQKKAKPFKLKLHTIKGKELHPDIKEGD